MTEEKFISKSQIKREMHDLQETGKQLLTLKKTQLAKIPLTEDLEQAIEEAGRIGKHEATRRHLQYIGKLMRDSDHEAIRAALDKVLSPHSMRHMELMRDKLVLADSSTLNDLIQEIVEKHPAAERQKLSQLTRNAKKEAKALLENPEEGKALHGRKLFKYLSSLEDE